MARDMKMRASLSYSLAPCRSASQELLCGGQLAVNIVFIIDGVQEHGWRVSEGEG